MGSFLLKMLKKIKNENLQRAILKILFRMKGLRLQEFTKYRNKFYIYKVNDKYIPSEYLNWYMSFDYINKYCGDTSLYKYKPKKGDVVIDVGAGLGEEAIVASAMVGDAGKVYSIEANPGVFPILKEMVEKNNLKNVEPLNLAINYEDAPINITDEDDSYKTGFVENTAKKSSVEIEGMRFDSFIKKYNLQRIDLLKCNIEGAERFLVDSISKEYLPRIRNVAIACHDFRYSENQNPFFVTKEYVKKFLTDNNFEIETRNIGVDFKDDWVYGTNLKTI
jgi:FkbM family methyltransferase